MNPPRAALALALVAFSLSLTGCSSEEGRPDASSTDDSDRAATVTAVATYPYVPGTPSLLAIGGGTFRSTRGCVHFGDGTIPVFPDGFVTWDGTSLMFGGVFFSDGDEISVGGGYIQRKYVPDLSLPLSCQGDNLFMVGGTSPIVFPPDAEGRYRGYVPGDD